MKGKKKPKGMKKKDMMDKKLKKGNGKQKRRFWEAFLIEHMGDWEGF